MNPRPGRTYHFGIKAPDGTVMWGHNATEEERKTIEPRTMAYARVSAECLNSSLLYLVKIQ
jgi:hypothetical protein